MFNLFNFTYSSLRMLVCFCGLPFLILNLTARLPAQTVDEAQKRAGQQMLVEGFQLAGEGHTESLNAALAKFNDALALFKSINYLAGQAAALSNIGTVIYLQGDKKKAIDYQQQALVIARGAGAEEEQAYALMNLGRMYHNDSGDDRKALEYVEEALPLLISSKKNATESINLIKSLYESLGDLPGGVDYFTRVIQLFRNAEDVNGEAATLNALGMLHWFMHDKPKALDYYLQALPLFKKVNDPPGLATNLNNIGLVLTSFGEYQRARDYFEQDLALSRSHSDPDGQSAALTNIGRLDLAMRDYKKARENFDEALAISRTVKNLLREERVLGNICGIYDFQGQKQKALECSLNTLPLARRVNDGEAELGALMNIGFLNNLLGRKQIALKYYAEALSLSRTSKDRESEAIVQSYYAQFYRDRGDLQQAQTSIEATLAIIEPSRNRIGSLDLRASYTATEQFFYETYIDILMRLHEQQPRAGYDLKAFQISERARSRSLLEMLTEAGANTNQGIDAGLRERERSLQSQLNSKAQRRLELLAGPHTEDEAKTIALEIETLTSELQRVRGQIRESSPFRANLLQSSALSLSEIQRLLDEDSLLLEYSLGEPHSYLWVITPSSLTSYQLPKKSDIEKVGRRFYELLASRHDIYASAIQRPVASSSRPDSHGQEAATTVTSLSQMLLGPVASKLGNKRLLIATDGILHYLPFAALLDPALTHRQPLIMQHEVVNLPSVSILAILRKELTERTPAPKELVILADPVFHSDDDRVIRNSDQGKSDGSAVTASGAIMNDILSHAALAAGVQREGNILARLKGSRIEAEKIAALASDNSVTKVVDFAANHEFATSGELSNYRNVVFATHAFVDRIRPELSAIVLSLVDRQGQPIDGYLRAHELYNLELRADLVVLSACETGLGKEVEGEGLMGLTRGFMYAGAVRVVVSLWSVDDAATADLMVSFYRAMLKEGKRPAEALRAAQLEIMKQPNWQAPYYWAALVLQGEWK